MADAGFAIQDDFPPVSYDEWRQRVDADLKGAPFEKKLVSHTYDGLDFQPLYASKDAAAGEANGFPGMPNFVRGGTPVGASLEGLELTQEHAHPDPVAANTAIIEDLAGGVNAILLKLDDVASLGCDADQPQRGDDAGQGGLMAYSVDELDAAMDGVHLEMIGVALDAGAAFLPAAATLAGLWRRRGLASDQARGAFGADPLAALARRGELPYSVDEGLLQLVDVANWTSSHYPNVTAVAIDTAPYHDAGATAAQDLAFGLATGVVYLRAMGAAGIGVDDAARQIVLRMSLGTHHFLAIAKLRAARRLWWQLLEACGGTKAAGVPRIHARTSDRVLTRRDPSVNILRNSVAVFAACVGGADAVTSVPFDRTVGLPSELSRRMAHNTPLVLQEESSLHRVIDPAGGSWFLDTITDELAEEAWGVFQEIEGRGGMATALTTGWAKEQVDAAFNPRAKDIARRKEPITGISEFPNAAEELHATPQPDLTELRAAAAKKLASSRPTGVPDLPAAGEGSGSAAATDAAAAGATIGQLAAALGFQASATQIEPLAVRSFAAPFEELRDAADKWKQERGSRPRVFLANMGPIAHHTARATYSKNFFEAGGFEVITNDGFGDDDAAAAAAFAESGAAVATICSSDKLYPDLVPKVTAALRDAGARTIILAGHPGETEAAWREAGVDRFIFMRCDVLATLQELLQEEGVLAQ